MKIFPTTEAYAVSYIPGTSGSFLCLLISEFTKSRSVDADFSNHGNAHTVLFGRPNQVVASDFDKSMLKDGELMCRYLETDPADPAVPIALAEHYPIDNEIFLKKYPLGKILYVQVDPVQDGELIEANIYFKIQVDCYHTMPFWNELWKTESVKYFGGAKDPFDDSITPEMIMAFIKDKQSTRQFGYPYLITDTIDGDNVYLCSFSDVIRNKTRILNLISELTGRPIPDSAYKIYDDYLKAQQPIHDFLNENT